MNEYIHLERTREVDELQLAPHGSATGDSKPVVLPSRWNVREAANV
jgi:hypothetical protein